MRRRVSVSLGAGCLAALGLASAAAGGTVDENKLAQRYAPVVRSSSRLRTAATGSRTSRSTSTCCSTSRRSAARPWNPTDLIEDRSERGRPPRALRVPPRLPRECARSGLRLRAVGDARDRRPAPTVYAHVATDPTIRASSRCSTGSTTSSTTGTTRTRATGRSFSSSSTPTTHVRRCDRAGVGRLQPARGGRGGGVGRREARARRRHASGRVSGGRFARQFLRVGALPRQLGLGRVSAATTRPARASTFAPSCERFRAIRPRLAPCFRGLRTRAAGASCSGRSSTARRAPT